MSRALLPPLLLLAASTLATRPMPAHCRELLEFHEVQLKAGKMCSTSFNSSIGFQASTSQLEGAALVNVVGHDNFGKPTFMSGGAQDLWVYINHARFLDRPGFFVDLATNHPIIRSNTYILEQCLGWKGLCIEPTPALHAAIRRERKCTLIPNCISERGGNVSFWVAEGNTAGASRIGKAKPGAGHFESIQCRTLADVLDEHDVRHVDYLSLDV